MPLFGYRFDEVIGSNSVVGPHISYTQRLQFLDIVDQLNPMQFFSKEAAEVIACSYVMEIDCKVH